MPRQFAPAEAVELRLAVLADPAATLSPAAALPRLNSVPAEARRMWFTTHLAETPFWFLLSPPAIGGNSGTFIDLPSRHAQTVACWRADPGLALLGEGDRKGTRGAIRSSKAGFALSIGAHAADTPILCKGTFSGPGYISASALSGDALEVASFNYHQNAALITGGLLMLAIFVFVTALINREWTYVIFAAWLVGNLRLCANAMGFDTEWLGRLISPDHLPLLRAFTFPAYYLITETLFVALFRNGLRTIGAWREWRGVRYVGCVLMVAAFVLSYRNFLPVLWVSTSYGVLVISHLLIRLVIKARSRAVLWFAASMAVVLLGTLSEVLAAAFGMKAFAGIHSPVITALSSSMLCAFALAEGVRAERERRRQMEAELRITYEVTPIGLFTLNLQNGFVRANPAAHAMLGLPEKNDDTRRLTDYFGSDARDFLRALLDSEVPASVEIEGSPGTRTAGRRYSLRATRSGDAIEGSLEDVTDRSKAMDQLQFLVGHDSLTGLLNRRGIEHAIEERSREGGPWAVAYLDLDRFKVFNDLYGHITGDEILKKVASLLVEHFGAHVPIGRIGGDEFVCVLPRIGIDDAIQRCQALLMRFNAAAVQVDSRAFRIRGSVGIVECVGGERILDVIGFADRACRAAKRHVKERLVAIRKGAPAFAERAAELDLIENLGQSHLPDGLFLVMQPIMSMREPTQSLNFEVLLRMRAKDGSVQTAAKLIAAAEDSGTIMEIDRWVMSTILAWLRDNHASLPATRFVCVNLSAGSLNDEYFLDELFALLSRYRDVVHYLCIEITESVALHDLEHTERFIERVQGMGAKIAIDDFGAGHTSLRYLKNLTADALKIDGAFVRTMCHHPADIAIVESLIALARNLGMRSIAEWVEDLETFKKLEELGVDYVQGFGVAVPQEADRILAASSAADFVVKPEFARYLAER